MSILILIQTVKNCSVMASLILTQTAKAVP